MIYQLKVTNENTNLEQITHSHCFYWKFEQVTATCKNLEL